MLRRFKPIFSAIVPHRSGRPYSYMFGSDSQACDRQEWCPTFHRLYRSCSRPRPGQRGARRLGAALGSMPVAGPPS
jgi:hypothetical protein